MNPELLPPCRQILTPSLTERISELRTKLGRTTTAALFVLSSTFVTFSAEETVQPTTAHADTLGYPWPTNSEAPCEFGSEGGTSCTNPNDPSDKYDWGISAGGVFHPYRENGGYEYRNCTDYTAWRLESVGVPSSKVNGLGNGGQWYNNAPAGERSSTPLPWDAAVVPSTGSTDPGHVAFIESVNQDGTITVSEYNHHEDGTGDTWTGYPADRGFTEFVDFGVHAQGSVTQADLNQNVRLNNDYYSDLAVARSVGGLTVGYGTSNGVLSEGPLSLTNWSVPSWASAGDFNGDGYSDILVAQSGGGFALALGNSSGIFSEGGTTLAGWGTGSWAGTGDFYTNSGVDTAPRSDFVTARAVGGFAVAYGTPNGTLAEGPVSLTNWSVTSWAGTGDFNGDGYSDILDAQAGGGFALALGHSNGIFTEGGSTLPGWGTTPWAGTGNFYGDTRSDLVVARASGGFAVAYGTPNGTLLEGPVSLTNWSVSSWAGTGDFNGDGYTDILVAQPGGGFALALGHSDGIFTEGGTVLPGWGVGSWASNGAFTNAIGYGYTQP